MKILNLVNTADSQSIPFELAAAMARAGADVTLAAWYARSDHPEIGGEKVHRLEATRPFDRAAMARLARLIDTLRPDIVHVHHAASALAALAVIARRADRPRVVKTEHNDLRRATARQRAVALVPLRLADSVICNSDTTRASFSWLDERMAGRKALRIYNGVDIARVRAAHARRRPGFRVIGTVGRLVPQKNHARLIAAFAEVERQAPGQYRLEIVGEGPLGAALRAQAQHLGIDGSVRFAGGLDRDAVYARLSSWDGFVMPSLFEGFCNALVEAMAARRPVACADIDTLREVAGSVPRRFDPCDPAAIANALLTVCDLSPVPDAFVARYDIERCVDRHLTHYGALLSRLDPQISWQPVSATARQDRPVHGVDTD